MELSRDHALNAMLDLLDQADELTRGRVHALTAHLDSVVAENGRMKEALAAEQATTARLQAAVAAEQAGTARMQDAVAAERAENSRLRGELERLQQAVARLNADIVTIRQSSSWRVTAPLRMVRLGMGRAIGGMRRD